MLLATLFGVSCRDKFPSIFPSISDRIATNHRFLYVGGEGIARRCSKMMLRILQCVYLHHPPILAKEWQRLEGTLHGTCFGLGKVLIDKAAEFEACYLGIYSAKPFARMV